MNEKMYNSPKFDSKDFKLFANSRGVNSLTLFDYQNSVKGVPSGHSNFVGQTPYIFEEQERRGHTMDVFSRLMVDRTIFLGSDVNADISNIIIAQLLWLNTQDSKSDVTMYVASPGGRVDSGYGIIDTMNFIQPDVSTTNVYLAASMGAMILSAGAKGKRFALKHARTMIHQPLGGAQGQASDMEITLNEMRKIKEELYQDLVRNTGQSYERIKKDADRDYWMTSEEAKEYGIIDDIIERKR